MKDLIIQFYEKYADFAFRVAFIRTNNRADSEDLSQEVMLKIIKNHDILRELVEKNEAQAKGYLAKAVINMTIEKYNKSSNRLKREKAFAMNKESASEDEYQQKDHLDQNNFEILNAIKVLPEKYQTIIMLKFYEGHSNSELSNMLNLKEVSIRSLVSRAIQKLKKHLVTAGVIMSAINITQKLEAIELPRASIDFKEKVILELHRNYIPPLPRTKPYFSAQSASLAILSTILFFFVLNHFFFNANPKTTHKNANNISIVAQLQPTNDLFTFELNMKDVKSSEELHKLVKEKLGESKEPQSNISFEKKGVIAKGQQSSKIKLPYELTKEKPIRIVCDAEILERKRGLKSSSIGPDFTVYSISKAPKMFSQESDQYTCVFTIIENMLYVESHMFKGLYIFRIDDKEFNKNIGIEFYNTVIKRVTLRELGQDEIDLFIKTNGLDLQLTQTSVEAKQPKYTLQKD